MPFGLQIIFSKVDIDTSKLILTACRLEQVHGPKSTIYYSIYTPIDKLYILLTIHLWLYLYSYRQTIYIILSIRRNWSLLLAALNSLKIFALHFSTWQLNRSWSQFLPQKCHNLTQKCTPCHNLTQNCTSKITLPQNCHNLTQKYTPQ